MSTAVEKASAPVALSPGEERWRMAQAMAKAGMLPKAYRNSPGDILLAQEYGLALGIGFTQVLTDIHVIEGRPSMSANLMQALIRKAGHRIRIRGDNRSATCSIVRKDDPEFPYSVTYTLDDAKLAGLMGKDNWRKYPASMLQARAIAMCARQACADVLAGIAYVPDELDTRGEIVDAEPIIDQTPPLGGAQAPPQGGAADEWMDTWDARYDEAVQTADLELLERLGAQAVAMADEERTDRARAAWHEAALDYQQDGATDA